MASIHGRVSRGGDAVLTRGRRHSGRGGGGMGGLRGSHAYTERVAVDFAIDHVGHLLSSATQQGAFRG